MKHSGSAAIAANIGLWVVMAVMIYMGAEIRPGLLAIVVVAATVHLGYAVSRHWLRGEQGGRLAPAVASCALMWLTGLVAGLAILEPVIVRRFFQISYYSRQWAGNTEWLGIPAEQHPCDNWVMQEIIYEVKPDFIIETGTLRGGSALYYATLLDRINPDARIITIDIDPQVEEASKRDVFRKYVEIVKSDSVAPELLRALRERVAGKKVIVTLDSLHTKEHVLKELELYSPLVSKGSYLVVQDTNLNGHPVVLTFGPGPMEALKAFLKTTRDFVVDRTREKFLVTQYPSGYLKRVQ